MIYETEKYKKVCSTLLISIGSGDSCANLMTNSNTNRNV